MKSVHIFLSIERAKTHVQMRQKVICEDILRPREGKVDRISSKLWILMYFRGTKLRIVFWTPSVSQKMAVLYKNLAKFRKKPQNHVFGHFS